MRGHKGKTNNPNGRPKGIPNKATLEFKQAINNLLDYAAPKMVEWLEQIDDPSKRLDHISKLAEYAHPKLARSEHVGDADKPIAHTVRWSE
jgi:hypothetical protein